MVIMERRFLPNGRKQRFMVIGAATMFSSLPTGRKSKMDRHAVFQHPRPNPLDPKSLRKHFALEIGIGAAEANFLVCRLFLATIQGAPPPAWHSGDH